MMRNPSYYIALAREAEQAGRYTVAAGKPGKYDSEIERCLNQEVIPTQSDVATG